MSRSYGRSLIRTLCAINLEEAHQNKVLDEQEVRLLYKYQQTGSIRKVYEDLRKDGHKGKHGYGLRSIRKIICEAQAKLEAAYKSAARPSLNEIDDSLRSGLLTPRQARALEGLLTHPTKSAVAQMLGISRAALDDLERRGLQAVLLYRKVKKAGLEERLMQYQGKSNRFIKSKAVELLLSSLDS